MKMKQQHRISWAGTAIGSIMANQMKSGMSPASAQAAALTAKHPSTHVKLWTQLKSVRFKARFEWEEKLRVWQIAYAGDVVLQTVNRRDAIWYEHKGERSVGIIQAIFAHYRLPKSRVLLTRRLVGADAEIGNEHIVTTGSKRFKYDLVEGDTRIDCISKHEILRCCVLVPDPWQSSKRYGAKTR